MAKRSALTLERRVVAETFGQDFDLAVARRLGAGSRRALRLSVEQLRWGIVPGEVLEEEGNAGACIRVTFVLPKGAYATTVLAAAFALESSRSRLGPPPTEPAEDEER